MAKHKLDELFAAGLENFEPSPAPAAWEQIESQLDQKKSKGFWAWAGIAATAALLLASSWLMFSQNAEPASYTYDYAEASIENLSQPAEVVYVPIYIYTSVERPQKKDQQPGPAPAVKQNIVPAQEEPVMLAQSEEIPVEQPEIITLEEVPVAPSDDLLVASVETPVANEPEQLQPVTIIYKQGEPAEESNFIKAMNYMEDVRMGEKKLLNFDKLRENIRSRFRSEEGSD